MKLAPHLPQIVELIRTSSVIAVTAPLNSGATILIPAALAAVQSRCCVIGLNHAAALSAYQTALQQARTSMQPSSPSIVYLDCDEGRRQLLTRTNFCDVLIVDAACPLIVELWQAFAQAGTAVPRLVILGASKVSLAPPPVEWTLPDPCMETQVHYHPSDLEGIDEFAIVQRVEQIARTTTDGHIVVLVPEAMCPSIMERIREALAIASGTSSAEVVPLHQPSTATRMILVGSGFSVPIEGIGHVVDSMQHSVSMRAKNGGTRTITRVIPRTMAAARSQVAPHYYPMLSAAQYRKLTEALPSPISYSVMLELMEAGVSPETVVPEVAGDVRLLIRSGMFRKEEGVTAMGRFITHFPLSPRNSAFLCHWIANNYPIFPGLVVAVLVDCGPNYCWVPRKRNSESPEQYAHTLREYKETHFGKIVGTSDVETDLNLWNSLTTHFRGVPAADAVTLSAWAYTHSYHYSKLQEVLTVLELCRASLIDLGHTVEVGPFTVANVTKAARPLLKSVYADAVMKRTAKGTYRNSTGETYRLDTREGVNCLTTVAPAEIIALATTTISPTLRLITCGLETEAAAVVMKRTVTRGDVAPIRSAPTTTAPALATIASEVDQEYLRFQCVQHIKETVTRMSAHPYEALNCVERWLLTLANAGSNNVNSSVDPIFTAAVTQDDAVAHVTLTRELLEKNMANAAAIVRAVRDLALEYLATLATSVAIAPTPQYEADGIVTVGTFRTTMSPGRVDLLRSRGTEIAVARMALRYACLLHRGQQWSLPPQLHRLLVSEYGVTLEAFASPINSQIIAVNPDLKFCSVFPDTDEVFGSVGSFFEHRLDNEIVLANPPFVNDLMEAMVDKITADLETATNLRIFITVPCWADAPYYSKLATSSWLRKSIFLGRGTHSYVDMSTNTRIPAAFDSCIFIVSKGYQEIDYEAVGVAIVGAMQ